MTTLTLADCSVGDNVTIPGFTGPHRITSRLTHSCLLRRVLEDGRIDDTQGPWPVSNDVAVTMREKSPARKTKRDTGSSYDPLQGELDGRDEPLWKGRGA